ncbi:hypothetical protein BYT27DRAFT_6740196 [Phlegmacium glaucopus]|nr:hypothetical protein BYT27DRAFT_6740196 [Phlegmacium glaucopus]
MTLNTIKLFIVYFVVLCLLFIPWFLVTGIPALHPEELPLQTNRIPPSPNTPVLDIEVDIVKINLDEQTLSLAWFPWDYSKCDGEGVVEDIQFFLEPGYVIPDGSDESIPSNNNLTTSSKPIYYLNTTIHCDEPDRVDYPLFYTDIRIFPWVLRGDESILYSLEDYPFDQYQADIFMVAQEVTSHVPLRLRVKYSIAFIPGFQVAITAREWSSNPEAFSQIITLSRSLPAKVYAVLIAVTTFIVSIVFFVITGNSLLFGYSQRVEILLLPVAAMFALTQLRATIPGVPRGTGTILDYSFILPSFGILTITTLGSIVSVAFTRFDIDRPDAFGRRCKFGDESASIRLTLVIMIRAFSHADPRFGSRRSTTTKHNRRT